MRKVLLACLLIIITLSLIGCSEKSASENGVVNVVVSKDFGKEKLEDKNIDILDDVSVMEVMEENFDIETAYGGGFINAINGLKSGFTGVKDKRKTDWFYYVNGILAGVGAREYHLKPDDIVIWDYHDWSNNTYGSSIIGAYPMNFINGHADNVLKTEIIYEKNFEEESRKLLGFLKERGLKDIEIRELDEEQLEDGQINSIVIGRWNDVSKLSYINHIYENGDKFGLFFKAEKSIQALNEKGDISKEYERGAIITSVIKEYGLTGTIWLITGNDDNFIKKAVKLLYEDPEKIRGAFSVIIIDDNIIDIPVKK
ncbi:DUF4430 domain-containing protein [Paramaledivibacter caminithermalis]|jgi:hypothetical protein|uniref:Transcobalamin-like C-terminal domain-containing protein n=1 Tax=Paramaledivibacter caminithermalis (strain DSM 15212 / CIP 107654 / DViRD3) TaxID=1121301 RepID=A0A1M6R9G3_PARC5|nr:DUF4430 domain-containing protein [Paramaledivibacter caminithermalis]SHK28968.1 protein of unknown function [Paramaledivibacter caminithermalis DSM 15212]